MVSRSDAERLRRAQAGIRGLVERDLRAFFGSLDLSRPEVSRDALLEFVPVLVASYGESAAAVAADWYDEVRAAERVRGRFRARMTVPDEREAVEGTVRRAAGALFTDAPSDALVALSGPAGKYVVNASRATVRRSTFADPQAAGWQRVTRAGSCGFCQMLAGRGGVYKRETVRFAAHGDCGCTAVPSWDQDAPEVDVAVYEASERTTHMSDKQREEHNARARSWMADHGLD
jgi:hypothetical protein